MRVDKKKAPVGSIVQRKGKVVAKVLNDVRSKSIYPLLRKHVAPESVIYTDEFPVYAGIPKMRKRGATGGTPMNFKHYQIKHKGGNYVRNGHIHTNSVEGFWSLVK